MRGYDAGCAGQMLSIDELPEAIRAAHEDNRPWELELDGDLPLAAFAQVLTSLYRAELIDFTLVSGAKRRGIVNRRKAPMLAITAYANGTFRTGVEQETLALGGFCPRKPAPLGDTFERCLAEVRAQKPAIAVKLDAVPDGSAKETRTVLFLWSVLDRIDAELDVALML